MTNKKEKKRLIPTQIGYNKLAPYYNFLLYLSGGYLIKAQRKLIPFIEETSKALLVGEGTGNFLSKLIASNKVKTIFCLDISEKMIQICQKKNKQSVSSLGGNKRVHYIIGDLFCLYPNNLLDANQHLNNKSLFSLITTNFFLDQFKEHELEKIMQRLDMLLTPGGYWYFTDFTLPKNFFQKNLVKGLYIFFQKVCNIEADKVPDYHRHFLERGYTISLSKKSLFGVQTILYKKPGPEKKVMEK